MHPGQRRVHPVGLTLRPAARSGAAGQGNPGEQGAALVIHPEEADQAVAARPSTLSNRKVAAWPQPDQRPPGPAASPAANRNEVPESRSRPFIVRVPDRAASSSRKLSRLAAIPFRDRAPLSADPAGPTAVGRCAGRPALRAAPGSDRKVRAEPVDKPDATALPKPVSRAFGSGSLLADGPGRHRVRDPRADAFDSLSVSASSPSSGPSSSTGTKTVLAVSPAAKLSVRSPPHSPPRPQPSRPRWHSPP